MTKISSIILTITFIFGSVDYTTQIQPIFNASCGGSHLSKSAGGLNLSNYSNLMSSGSVVPGNHLAS